MTADYVVLDTNILVSALLSPQGPPAAIYKMFLAETIMLAYNSDILDEYREVLFRPRLRIPQDEAVKMIEAIRE